MNEASIPLSRSKWIGREFFEKSIRKKRWKSIGIDRYARVLVAKM